MSYTLWDCKELDTTEQLTQTYVGIILLLKSSFGSFQLTTKLER